MNQFKYRPSVLNIGMMIWIFIAISLLFYTDGHIAESTQSGRGMLQVIYLIGLGMIGIIVDLILQKYISNRTNLAIIEVILLIVVVAITILK